MLFTIMLLFTPYIVLTTIEAAAQVLAYLLFE